MVRCVRRGSRARTGRVDSDACGDDSADPVAAELVLVYGAGTAAGRGGVSALAVSLIFFHKKTGEERNNRFIRRFSLHFFASQSAFNLVAAQATRANGHTLRYAIDQNMHLLRVRSPGAARLAVRMADVIAINNALAANFTILSHTLSHLLQGYVTTNSRIIPRIGCECKTIRCKNSDCQEKIEIQATSPPYMPPDTIERLRGFSPFRALHLGFRK